MQEMERLLIVETLRRAGGNIKESAATLGIDRSTLYEKIRISWTAVSSCLIGGAKDASYRPQFGSVSSRPVLIEGTGLLKRPARL